MLTQGKIALEKISGIAKDGSIFNAPEQDLLPEPLEIGYEALENSIIVLKTSLGSASIADIALRNNFPNSKYLALLSVIASRIYDDHGNDISPEVQDERDPEYTTFTQEKMSIALASLRLKLGILGHATPDELEIPIAKIKSVGSNKKNRA